MLNGAATVLNVADMPAALAYWRDCLGFEVSFTWGTPLAYAGLCRDAVQVHLRAASPPARPAGVGAVCIFVADVDAVHAALCAAGARVLQPPWDYPYGMRDFDVSDLDGNHITFGMASAAA